MNASTGEVSFSACNLLAPRSAVSLQRLALLFSTASWFGDFVAEPLWRDLKYAPYEDNWLHPPRTEILDPHRLVTCFRETTERVINGASNVAIAFSGGLDSTAVLSSVVAVTSDATKIIALTLDQRSDQGESSCAQAAPIISAISARVQHFRSKALEEPEWDARGPCSEAMPWLTAGMAREALDLGAEMMMIGAGSDESLGTPRYLLPDLVKGSIRAGWGYLRMASEGGYYGKVAELAHMFARAFLSPRTRARAFHAINHSELSELAPSRLLMPKHRDFVDGWDHDNIQQSLAEIESGAENWSEIDARESLLPLSLPVTSSRLRHEYPFLACPFLTYGQSLRLTDRFGPSRSNNYFRRKSLILSLIPERVHACLPTRKQTFRSSIHDQIINDDAELEIVYDIGLVDRGVYQRLEFSEFRPFVRNLEGWLRGALKRNYAIENC